MINETIWLPCLVISVCLSAAFVVILMEHRRNGRVLVDQLTSWFDARMRTPPARTRDYFEILQARFQNSSRDEQELYILRLSQAATIGGAMLLLNFIYPFLPTLARALVLPVVGLLAWLLASKLVAPNIVARLVRHLNPPK